MLAVQVSLESLATEDPVVSPEGTHDTQGIVEHVVNLEDDEGNEVDCFHGYFFMILLVRLSNQSVVVRVAARIIQPRNPE